MNDMDWEGEPCEFTEEELADAIVLALANGDPGLAEDQIMAKVEAIGDWVAEVTVGFALLQWVVRGAIVITVDEGETSPKFSPAKGWPRPV